MKIETDRYQGIPVDKRICKLCTSNDIEDTYHFMFKCPALQNIRNRTINQLNIPLDEHQDKDKLRNLLNKNNILSCGKLVEALYRERQNIVYK